jgi:pimeloyl-ACP methyl ester carboxylesterase
VRLRAGALRLIGVAIAAALISTCTPAPPAASGEPKVVSGDPETPQAGSIELGSGALAYHLAQPTGSQVTLLAVHGGPGMTSDYMVDLDELASQGITVVRFDQRGSGRSTLPTASFSLESYMADVHAVWRALSDRPVVLFGHSWGGLLSLAYAAAHPEAVRGLVLFGSAPPTDRALQAGSLRFDAALRAGQRAGWIEDDIPASLPSLAPILPVYFADPGFDPPEGLDAPEVSTEVNAATWQALGAFDLRDRVASIHRPVLFFYGEADPFGRQMALATLDALSGTDPQVVWLPDCGHFWQECPDAFHPPLMAFLRRMGSR